jgi:hypothetical protein
MLGMEGDVIKTCLEIESLLRLLAEKLEKLAAMLPGDSE